MKKIYQVVIFIMLTAVFNICVSSCSSSDDGGGTSVIDGVNVKNGKKLVKLDIQTETTMMDKPEYKLKIKIDYDSKNRLSKITCNEGKNSNNGKQIDEIISMKIDYDFKMVTLSDGTSSRNYMFALNDKGYISQIANYYCKYDSYGYLIGVENNKEMWSLAYNEGELIKSLYNYKQMDIYYMFYGEDQKTGDLLFTINVERDNSYGNNSTVAAMYFIAYQAGLFGKITTHCTYLTRSNETAAILEKNTEKSKNKFRAYCSFTFE